jgi:2-methylcitrate dehydratase PrpD
MAVQDSRKLQRASNVTAFLAQRTAELRYEHLSDEARTVAGHCFLDFFGVALAGSHEPLTEIMAATVAEDGGSPHATVIGRGSRGSVEQAALLNGAMAHALDFDDVHMAVPGHPTVSIGPTVLALGEWRGTSGREIITSFAAGVEMACRVGLMTGPSHYAHGWHPTATVGAIGAAAAAANLLGLDADRTAHALGIAATQAAGLKSVFGTMCKPMHAGHAAATGVQAARLAARGFTSNPAILDVEQGFIATQSTTADPQAALHNPPGGFYLPQVLFKYHATCYFTHSSIEALGAIRREFAPRPESVRRVVLRVSPGHLRICNILEPKTALEAKFSLRMTSALALLGENTASEAVFCDATMHRPDVINLCDKVEVEPRQATSETLTEVFVHLDDGTVLRQVYDVGIPETDLAAQGDKLKAKFMKLAEPALGADAARAVAERCGGLSNLQNLTELCQLVGRKKANGA